MDEWMNEWWTTFTSSTISSTIAINPKQYNNKYVQREREIGMCSAIEEHTLTFDDLTTATMAKNNARKK